MSVGAVGVVRLLLTSSLWGVMCLVRVLLPVVHCGMFRESVHRPRLILLRCFRAWRFGLSSLEVGVT